MVNETELNIVILPDEKTKEIAVDLSRKLRENFETDFALDGKTKHPHITIYPMRLLGKNIDAAVAYLKTIANRMAPFEVALGKFYNTGGYVCWRADLTNEFAHLQKAILYQLNPLREGLVQKLFQNVRLGMDETYNIQNYGYNAVGSLFQPHITLTHITDQQHSRKAVEQMRPRVTKFVATKIHLGTTGEFGTVMEILEEFPFGGQSPYMLRPQNYF